MDASVWPCEPQQSINIGALKFTELTGGEEEGTTLMLVSQLLKSIRIRGITSAGFLSGGQFQVFKEDFTQLFGTVDVEILS